jgi:hypothetical protein
MDRLLYLAFLPWSLPARFPAVEDVFLLVVPDWAIITGALRILWWPVHMT